MTDQQRPSSASKRPRKLGRGLSGLIPSGVRRSVEVGKESKDSKDSAEASTVVTESGQSHSEGMGTPVVADEIEGVAPFNQAVEVKVSPEGSPRGTSQSTVVEVPSGRTPATRPDVPRGTEPEASMDESAGRFELVDADAIRANPHQPREYFDSDAIEQLAASIRKSGLIQPITVRRIGSRLELVAGERRLKACKLAGIRRIPAIIRELSDRDTAEWALVENLQREDLNPLERAKGLRRLIDEFGLTHQQAAEAVGLERASVSNILRLLELDPGTASLVARGTLGQGHAKVLLAVSDLDVRAHLCRTLIAKSWSVRRLEMEVRKLSAPPAASSAPLADSTPAKSPTQIENLERSLSEHLGTRVQISLSRRRGQGRLLIDFHSLEHFDDLMERLDFKAE
jgi:ParB family chromosome partitioning protein